MTRRNQMLALLLLLGFAGGGVLYFRYWVVQKPFGIILIIAEGLTAQQLAPARVFAGGADTPLVLDRMPHSANVMNASADFATPDSAAAATAIATGVRVNNKRIGIAANGQALTNLVELARKSGRATGLVTDGRLTSAACAAFYAHVPEGSERAELARLLTKNKNFDVTLGGGAAEFLPAEKGGGRSDGRDLLLDLIREGIDVVRTHADLETLATWRGPRVAGVFADAQLAFTDQLELRETQPSLSDMVRRAIELLQYNRGGYFLVVDASLMRKAAEENSGERTLTEMAELDRAVGVAQRYAGSRSVVVVCGDVGIGGLSMNGAPLVHDHGLGVLGLNSAGEPWITWASGPHGTTTYGGARLTASPSPAATPAGGEEDNATHPPQEPAAFYTRAGAPTVSDVVAFGSGAGTERLHGTIHQTDIFRVIADRL